MGWRVDRRVLWRAFFRAIMVKIRGFLEERQLRAELCGLTPSEDSHTVVCAVPRQRLTLRCSIALTPADYERVRKVSSWEDMVVTAWMRDAIMASVVRAEEMRSANRARVALAGKREPKE